MPLFDLRDDDEILEDDEDEEEGGGGGDEGDGDDGGDGGGDEGGGDGGDDSGGGGGDWVDDSGDFDWGDGGGDSGGDDSAGDGGFDYGDQGGGNDGWSAVEDYEENGRKIRKFTDNTGTDYFQDVGEWEPRQQQGDGDGFDWGDTNQRDNWMRDQSAREMPDVDPDVRDLHDYFHPYTISKYEDDPVRKGWGDGIATDGTRFDQQDEATQRMFGSSFGDQAAQNWAEQRSRDLESEWRERGVVTVPRQEVSPDAGAGQPLFGLPRPTNPDGSPVQYTVGPGARDYTPMPANALGLGTVGDVAAPDSVGAYTPPAVESPPTPPAEAAPSQSQPAAPPAPPPGQQAAADAAARATAQAGGSPQQVADAAAAAALAYDRRNLSSESLDTQRQFGEAYGDQANERWVQQHNQELALNRGLYGTAEPEAGARQVGAIPGLGDVGPAPDRTIGQAQPAPWNRPATASPAAAPGAVGVTTTTPSTTGAAQPAAGLPAPIFRPPPPITTSLSPNVAQPGDSISPPAINAQTGEPTTLAPLPINGQFPSARPTPGEPGGLPLAPGPVLEGDPFADTPGGVPRTVSPNVVVQGPPISEGGIPLASPIPSDMVAGEQANDILTIRNGNGQVLQEPRWSWDQRGPTGQSVWQVVNAEGAPTQTMAEAGFERTSAVGPIDASLRQAANVPPPAESPTDMITIRDDAMGTTRIVPRSQLDSWMRPVAPGVPNPWRVVDVQPAAGAAPASPPAAASAPPPPVAPAGPSIDASVRTAAGVPPAPALSSMPFDPDQGPREGDRSLGITSDPFGEIVAIGAREQGATDVEGFGRNVAAGISAGEAWAEPYVQTLAQVAWYRESRGLEGTNAPQSYIRDWTNAFRAGNENVIGVKEASQAMVARGIAPPSNDPFGVVVTKAARDQGATDMTGFRRAVAGGIAAGEAWTRPYTEQLAQQAWYRESGGREGGPENAPQSYIADWTNGLRNADTNVPGVKAINQQLINLGARVPAPNGQPYNWQAVYGPTGEGLGANGPKLISQQATGIDCGPNAFSNIMRSQGYNAAPVDAFTFAKEQRYHTGGMFTGPANFANMLKNELGLEAAASRLDWNKVDQELAAGRLVTLSSPGGTGHYWTISAKNEQGQYYTGATGTFVGHAAWAKPGQISYANNPPDTMITYSGAINPQSRAVTSPTMKVQPPPTQQAPTMASAPAATRRMQSDEQTPQALVAPERQPEEETLWQATPQRWERMEAVQALPREERQRIFEDAMDRGLAAEGISGADADYWKNNMRTVVTGDGLSRANAGENYDLNPYMIAGESGGKRGTGRQANSTALGYFQFLRQNPDGSRYGHEQYAPDEYKDRPYDPVGQVRQFVRAIKASRKHRGDPGSVVNQKNSTGQWGP